MALQSPRMTSKKNIVVLGAGPGGLTAALALAMQGHAVDVLEQQAQLLPFGGGLQLGPNAMRILYALGLESALRDCVSWPGDLVVRAVGTGKVIAAMPLDPDFQQRYGAPWATIHRHDLQRVLLQQLEGRVDIHLKQSIKQVQLQGAQVLLQDLEQDHGQRLLADVVVAADGAHSAMRQQHRAQAQLLPSGQTAWRACFLQKALPMRLRHHQLQLWLGQGLHAVVYPVRRGECMNVVLCMPTAETHRDVKAPTLPEKACADFLDLMTAIAYQKHWTCSPLSSLPAFKKPEIMLPQANWPLVLLGDAAHAMLPHLAQGAGMAIEDAAVLASQLRQQPRVLDALRAYAEQRYRRVTQVQRRTVRNGKLYQAGWPLAAVRNLALRVAKRPLLDQKWLYKDNALHLGPSWLQPVEPSMQTPVELPSALMRRKLSI